MTFFNQAGLFLATHLPLTIVLLFLASFAGGVVVHRRTRFHGKPKTGRDL